MCADIGGDNQMVWLGDGGAQVGYPVNRLASRERERISKQKRN